MKNLWKEWDYLFLVNIQGNIYVLILIESEKMEN